MGRRVMRDTNSITKCKLCGHYLCGHEVYEKNKDDTLTLLKSVPTCKEKVEDVK